MGRVTVTILIILNIDMSYITSIVSPPQPPPHPT
jgi:hypothetical protein